MTRKAKKFIKRLMALGYSRNDAATLRDYAINSIFDYTFLFETARFSMRLNISAQDSEFRWFLSEQYRYDNLKGKSFTKAVAEFFLDVIEDENTLIKASGILEQYSSWSGIKPQAFKKRR